MTKECPIDSYIGLIQADRRDMGTILVVEDDLLSRRMMLQWLRRHGFTVLTASDGEQGLAMARQELPDLILMDMSLPVIDGWQVTQTLKSEVETRHIPIIALTAHALTGDRQDALDSGCDDYDTKPVRFARLLDKMNRVLASARD